MRTTVTIDEAVVRLLRKAMHDRQQSFKQVLNDALRRGLADIDDDVDDSPFHVHPHDMGLRAGLDPARLNALADDLEADAHVALTTRLLAGGTSA